MINSNDTTSTQSWEYEEEYHPPFLPALILFPPIAPLFWNYHVKVSDTHLDLGYSMTFHESVERKHIQSAEVVERINGLTQWGGWGYRKNLNWETGYIARNGPGVRLTYKTVDGGKDNIMVFNCNEAEKVCHLLNTPVLNAVVH